MAVTVKADTQDFPAILKAFGLGSMPDSAPETPETAPSASDAATVRPSLRPDYLQNTFNSLQATQQPVDVPGSEHSDIGTPSLPPASVSQPTQQAPQYQDKGSWYRDPGETKGHALMRILTAGIQGGLAGAAQNAETYAQTGRNAGFGGGIYGAQVLPWEIAARKQQVQLGNAQLQNLQSEADFRRAQIQQMGQSVMIQTPNGPMWVPFAIAKGALGSSIGGQYREKAAETTGQSREKAAEISKGVVVVPGKGMYQKDENGKYQPVEGAQLPNVYITPEEAQNLGHPELANQELPMSNYSQLLRGTAATTTTVQGAQGPSSFNKVTGKTKNLGLGSPGVAVAMSRPVQVSDPNNPGAITYTTAGNAIASGAPSPQSAPAQTAKATARSVAPGGKVGEEINAFNTAIQHADLLKQAAQALNNGDIKKFNSLKNYLATEFGDADLTNFRAISDVYQHEIQKMIAGGHMTNQEISAKGASLPENANFDTINKVLGSYKALAQSKLANRQRQVQKGQQGKPDFPNSAPAGQHPLEQKYKGFVVDQNQ